MLFTPFTLTFSILRSLVTCIIQCIVATLLQAGLLAGLVGGGAYAGYHIATDAAFVREGTSPASAEGLAVLGDHARHDAARLLRRVSERLAAPDQGAPVDSVRGGTGTAP